MTLKKKPEFRTTVRMPEDLHYAAKVTAAGRAEPLQEFIAEAVRMRIRSLGMSSLLRHPPKQASGT